jgi:drug/metabolite transporter (DMT)-like permease
VPRARLLLLTTLAMLAFAGNSLLCRAALGAGRIDPASFTALRVIAGALTLVALVALRRTPLPAAAAAAPVASAGVVGRWAPALALFVYAAAFSYAYVSLSAATGALLLFGAVQATMIGAGLLRGERLHGVQIAGLVGALGGLVALLLPGIEAPAPLGSALMIAAGVAWGVYSLRGRGSADPLLATRDNFVRAVAFAAALGLAMPASLHADGRGALLAVASGALASGIGYAVWYAALRGLSVLRASTVQLSVPVIAALGGVVLLGEAPGWRLVLAAAAILGGIALVIVGGSRRA